MLTIVYNSGKIQVKIIINLKNSEIKAQTLTLNPKS